MCAPHRVRRSLQIVPPCPERAQITPPPPVAAAVAWDTADAAMAPSTDASTWQMCQAHNGNRACLIWKRELLVRSGMRDPHPAPSPPRARLPARLWAAPPAAPRRLTHSPPRAADKASLRASEKARRVNASVGKPDGGGTGPPRGGGGGADARISHVPRRRPGPRPDERP